MGYPQVIEEIPMNIVELKQELAKIKKRDGELNFRANKCEDYLNKFVVLKMKEKDEILKALNGLEITRLKPVHIHKLIDMMPSSVNEVKFILSSYNLSLSRDDLAKIMDVFKKYI